LTTLAKLLPADRSTLTTSATYGDVRFVIFDMSRHLERFGQFNLSLTDVDRLKQARAFVDVETDNIHRILRGDPKPATLSQYPFSIEKLWLSSLCR